MVEGNIRWHKYNDNHNLGFWDSKIWQESLQVKQLSVNNDGKKLWTQNKSNNFKWLFVIHIYQDSEKDVFCS